MITTLDAHTVVRIDSATLAVIKRVAVREDRSISYVTRRALVLWAAGEQGRETARRGRKGGAK